MDNESYKQQLQAFSTQINDLMSEVEAFQKECRTAKKKDWVTTLKFVLHHLEQADINLCLDIQAMEEED